jgi:2'-hydroxyisoflavone reductase
MKLLVLGGTIFLGRYLVEAALARGHEVTLFNRGQHNPDLFPDVEKLRGDRNGDLTALAGRRWDAVIDTCGYIPRIVRTSAELLADAVEHYTFISSISVYPLDSPAGVDETAPVDTIEDETVEEITGETYGALKALCEQAAESAIPGRVLNIRPGLIVGPHDLTDRFTYWPARIQRGGEVMAPGKPNGPIEFIDVRDLADWNIRMAEDRQTGIYNATGPDKQLTMGVFLDTCREVLNREAKLTWVDESFLEKHQVAAFSEMPLWLPEAMNALNTTDCRKAFAAGLNIRPMAETIQATVAWAESRPADHAWRAGISSARELELLESWRNY